MFNSIDIWTFVQFFVSEAKFEWINQRDFRVSEAQKSIKEFAREKENHANKSPLVNIPLTQISSKQFLKILGATNRPLRCPS